MDKDQIKEVEGRLPLLDAGKLSMAKALITAMQCMDVTFEELEAVGHWVEAKAQSAKPGEELDQLDLALSFAENQYDYEASVPDQVGALFAIIRRIDELENPE